MIKFSNQKLSNFLNILTPQQHFNIRLDCYLDLKVASSVDWYDVIKSKLLLTSESMLEDDIAP